MPDDEALPDAELASDAFGWDSRRRRNALSCRISCVWVGQSCWRPVMVAAGGPARARGVSAAWCVGQPVSAGHAPDQVRCVGAGYPGRGDEQRAS
jgi:hypothetical protein